MPDSGISDGSVYTSSFHDTYVRQQVVTQCTSATRPTGVEGRMIYETDTDRFWVYDGSGWVYQNYATSTARTGVILTDATQAIVTATVTDVTWGTEVSDVDGWTSGGSATLTVPTGWTGQYLISYMGQYAAAAGATQGARLLQNGTAVASSVNGTLWNTLTLTCVRLLTAADTLKIQVYQSSGGNVNLDSQLYIARIGV